MVNLQEKEVVAIAPALLSYVEVSAGAKCNAERRVFLFLRPGCQTPENFEIKK